MSCVVDGRYSERAWQLLRVAAVLGERVDLSELASMMRQSVAELLPVLDELLARGAVAWAGDWLAFRVSRSAVLDELPAPVLTALRTDRDRLRGSTRLAPATDELSRAIGLVRAALARPGAVRLADDLHALLANLLLLKGQSAAARAAAERVLAAPDDRLSDEAAGTRLAAMALCGDPDTEATASEVFATAPPSSTRAVAAAFVLSNAWWDQGRLTESLRMARHRARIGGGAAPHWWLWQRLGLINKLGLLRRLDEANELMRATRAESANLASYEGNRVIMEAQLLLTSGQLTAAATQARAGVAAARSAGSPLLVPHGLAVQAAVALRADDLDTAVLMLAECEAVRAGAQCLSSTVQTWVAVRLAARRHGPRRALATADAAARALLLAGEPEAAPWLVRTALAAEDVELARTVVREATRLAQDNPAFPALAASAEQACASLAGEAAEPVALPVAELPDPGSHWTSFSDVERSIARLVAQGMTNRQIATRVKLSPHTVNYHLRVLFRKLGISSRTELVRHVPNSTAA